MPMQDPEHPKMPSRFAALEAVRTLIAYIGDDPDRPGLRDTPSRVLKAWEQDWGKGYVELTPDELLRMFEIEDIIQNNAPGQMVVVKDIILHSTCEHHMAPFFGLAHIAYIPDKGVVGLSKLARVVEYFSRKLQVQERISEQVAGFLSEHLSADVGVLIEAKHMCMCSRGVRQSDSNTITSALRGDFYTSKETRSEFLRLIGK